MKQENESGSIPPGTTPDSDVAGKRYEAKLTDLAKFDEVTINFHSAEFNCTDDLNDCTGNYRSFESLDGIVTAHERHQREIGLRRETPDPSRSWLVVPRRSKLENDEPEPLETAAPLTVISEGRTLIIDTDAERGRACGKTLLDHRLPCTLLVTGSRLPNTSVPRLGRIKLHHVDRVSVTGAFGGFSAKVTVGEVEKPLAEWFNDAAAFDLVLDLQPVPSFAGGRVPIGYYAPGRNSAALDEAMSELPEMRGQFKKPQFVAFYENRCFHGRSRTQDCHGCLEICPVSAIRSVDRRISINHYLCQGCGGCALACPAEAIRVIQPSPSEVLSSLQRSLERREADGVSPMSVVISDLALNTSNGFLGRNERDRGHRICFEVEQIAHVRLEVLLTAVAYNAKEILVACDPENPPAVRDAVEWQAQMARAILRGLDFGEERIRFLVGPPGEVDLTKTLPPACMSEQDTDTAPRTFPPGCDGRTLVYLLARYLRSRSGVQKSWLPLPDGSPFGSLTLNSSACTLCMACVSACPSGALSSGGKTPRLLFRESRCHQCGLCQEMCPEKAIQLVPRLLLDQGTTEREAVLQETEPFHCVECGIPFAPPAMIDRIKGKLAGHWMYANERQLRRLQMCGTCRTRDALTSKEMESWNL